MVAKIATLYMSTPKFGDPTQCQTTRQPPASPGYRPDYAVALISVCATK